MAAASASLRRGRSTTHRCCHQSSDHGYSGRRTRFLGPSEPDGQQLCSGRCLGKDEKHTVLYSKFAVSIIVNDLIHDVDLKQLPQLLDTDPIIFEPFRPIKG